MAVIELSVDKRCLTLVREIYNIPHSHLEVAEILHSKGRGLRLYNAGQKDRERMILEDPEVCESLRGAVEKVLTVNEMPNRRVAPREFQKYFPERLEKVIRFRFGLEKADDMINPAGRVRRINEVVIAVGRSRDAVVSDLALGLYRLRYPVRLKLLEPFANVLRNRET